MIVTGPVLRRMVAEASEICEYIPIIKHILIMPVVV